MAARVADGYSAQKVWSEESPEWRSRLAMNEEHRIQSDGSAVFIEVEGILVLRPISSDPASASMLLPRVMNCRLNGCLKRRCFIAGR